MTTGDERKPDLLNRYIDEQREFNQNLLRLGVSVPPPGAIPAAVIRRNRLQGKGGFKKPVIAPEAYDISIDGRAHSLRARVFPDGDRGATCIHIHGGGWVFGSIYEQDARLSELAAFTHCDVISLEYRLAPEHPFPAAVEDCVDAIVGLADGQARGMCRHTIILSGESAGAHLVAVALLRLRKRVDILARIAGLTLAYGIYDLSMTPSQRLWGDAHMVLSTPAIAWMEDQFLPGLTAEERRNPDISPLYADLAGLPPALFSVGAKDLLLDDSLFMAARWQAAGNRTELALYPEAPHGFNAMPTAMARAGNARIYRFVNDCLSASAL